MEACGSRCTGAEVVGITPNSFNGGGGTHPGPDEVSGARRCRTSRDGKAAGVNTDKIEREANIRDYGQEDLADTKQLERLEQSSCTDQRCKRPIQQARAVLTVWSLTLAAKVSGGLCRPSHTRVNTAHLAYLWPTI